MGISKYIVIFFLFSSCLISQNENVSKDNNESTFYNKLDSLSFSSFFNFSKKKYNDYNIALLLPFCVNNNSFLSMSIDSLIEDEDFLHDYSFYKKSSISIDFYLGFLLALDHFPDSNIKVSVFDILEGDQSRQIIREMLDDKILDNMDMIIGPLFTDNFIFFAENFDHDVPIIAPFSKNKHLTDFNKNIFQVQPNIEYHLFSLSSFIFEHHYNDNILFVSRDTMFESRSVLNQEDEEDQNTFDTIIPIDIQYAEGLLHNIDTTGISVRHIKVKSNIIDSIHHELDTLGMKNIVVIPSEDNVFVNDLLSKLHACRDTGLVVYGLPSLYNLNHISISDLMDMKLTFPYHQVDNNAILEDFILNFYNQYEYLPNINYASIGYEIGVFFLETLVQKKSIIPHVIEQDNKIVLQRIYDFEQYNKKGYKNDGVVILQYHDFGYRRLD